MQVKKFEAPTIQEALENVKRELGPEAIILHTKKNRTKFGLLSKTSIEITAAVSDRSLQKKQEVERKLTEPSRALVKNMPAEKQANLLDKYSDRTMKKAQETRERVEMSSKSKKITATRYIEIEDEPPVGKPIVQSPPRTVARTVEGNTSAARPTERTIPQGPTYSPNTPVHPSTNVVTGQGARDSRIENEFIEIKKTLDNLRRENDTRNDAQRLYSNVPVLQDVFDQLILQGIERRYAYALIKKIVFEMGEEKIRAIHPDRPEIVLDHLASEVMNSIQVHSIFGSSIQALDEIPKVIALVGVTGIGKSTTIAKLAREAMVKKNLKVGLINLDHLKPGAFEQLATYAKILNVPFRSATSALDFKVVLSDFQSSDVVLVDTGGCSQRDTEALKRTSEILRSVDGVKSYVVLSATTRDLELYDTVSRFSVLRPQGLIISKLDEATQYGSIYNVAQKTQIPLAYFTTGQKIPEDIEEATRERVASLIMDL